MNPKEKIAQQIIEKMEAPWKEPGPEWCLALHGNHDEHQCHKKPGHFQEERVNEEGWRHECHCGVCW